MELYVPEEIAPELIKISLSHGVQAQVVGRVEASPEKQVSIRSEFGEFLYS
jgi:phosphoribosylformylglycinamidine cyclo-ligase